MIYYNRVAVEPWGGAGVPAMCDSEGTRVLLPEILLPRTARQGAVCLSSPRGSTRKARIELFEFGEVFQPYHPPFRAITVYGLRIRWRGSTVVCEQLTWFVHLGYAIQRQKLLSQPLKKHVPERALQMLSSSGACGLEFIQWRRLLELLGPSARHRRRETLERILNLMRAYIYIYI